MPAGDSADSLPGPKQHIVVVGSRQVQRASDADSQRSWLDSISRTTDQCVRCAVRSGHVRAHLRTVWQLHLPRLHQRWHLVWRRTGAHTARRSQGTLGKHTLGLWCRGKRAGKGNSFLTKKDYRKFFIGQFSSKDAKLWKPILTKFGSKIENLCTLFLSEICSCSSKNRNFRPHLLFITHDAAVFDCCSFDKLA